MTMDAIDLKIRGDLREAVGQALLGPVHKAADSQAFIEIDREAAAAAGCDGDLPFLETVAEADARHFGAVRDLMVLAYETAGLQYYTSTEPDLRATWRAFVRDARDQLEAASAASRGPEPSPLEPNRPAAVRCVDCEHFSWFYPAGDEGDEGRGLCAVPSEVLPLSMAGYAMSEKETVPPSATGCPTFVQRSVE